MFRQGLRQPLAEQGCRLPSSLILNQSLERSSRSTCTDNAKK